MNRFDIITERLLEEPEEIKGEKKRPPSTQAVWNELWLSDSQRQEMENTIQPAPEFRLQLPSLRVMTFPPAAVRIIESPERRFTLEIVITENMAEELNSFGWWRTFYEVPPCRPQGEVIRGNSQGLRLMNQNGELVRRELTPEELQAGRCPQEISEEQMRNILE